MINGMDILTHIAFWYWLIAAIVMIILEMLIPAAYFLWMGISAFIVGLLLFMFPAMPLLVQITIFGALSVITLLLFKRYQRLNISTKDEPDLNRRGQKYIGRIVTLEEGIINGMGKIKVDDTFWKVKGDDLPAGTKVRILNMDGSMFNVAKEE